MADYGIKITKDNLGVSSTDIGDMSLWSKYAVGKIVKEGNGSGAALSTVTVDYSAEADSYAIWNAYISDNGTDWYIGGEASAKGFAFNIDDFEEGFHIYLGGTGTDYYKYFVVVDSFM